MKRILFLTSLFILLGVTAFAQDTTTANTGKNFTFSAESGYNAIYSPDTKDWSSAAYIRELGKVAAWGKSGQHVLYLLGRQDIVTGLGYTIYSGGARFQPDISSWLNAHTFIPGDRMQFYVEAEAGNAIDTSSATSSNHVAQRYGFGLPVKLGSATTWTPVTASYLRVGHTNFAELSTNVSIVFGH